MRKKFAALIAVVLLGLPISANALETDELIALTAMPLVVAAAAELTDVPTGELMSVVSTLNNAQVRPTQFVEVVRYAPVAIVSSTEPRFSTYVTTEYARGIVGDPLAIEIAERYPTYGVVEDIHLVDPPVITYVERQEILPQYVITRFEAQPVDPLALIAMPLAVAAVAETTNVPASDLISFIAALNRARMPAPQFVEVVRYSPVVLVDATERPVFLRYVTTQVDRGIIGRPLAFALADRIGIEDIARPRVIIDRDVDIFPTVVTTRVATTRSHPHGGPPGQLKKERGLQTGAEVVHGTRRSQPERVTRNRGGDDRPRVKSKPAKAQRVARPQQVKVKPQHVAKPQQVKAKAQHVAKPKMSKPQHVSNKGQGGGGGGKGHGNSGGGKGKGKGKG